jgi:hypothetical protein
VVKDTIFNASRNEKAGKNLLILLQRDSSDKNKTSTKNIKKQRAIGHYTDQTFSLLVFLYISVPQP